MPAGCTALDFAFSIHTFLGSHCIGAKVNHKLVPLSHKLQSGDQVEILTSKSQHVQASWINFVSTAKAKAKIQAIMRRNGRNKQRDGEDAFKSFLSAHGVDYTVEIADQIAAFHDIYKREDFFQAIGDKTILLSDKDIDEIHIGNKKETASKGWRKFVPFLGNKKKNAAMLEEAERKELFTVPDKFNRKKPIYITDDNINQYKFMNCCHPIPGDDILGFIDSKKQIEIHKRNCPVAAKLKTSFGNRILDAKWSMGRTLFFDATIEITGIDRIGLLNEVTQVISREMNVNIHRVFINCDDDIFSGKFELRVHDREDIKVIVDNLKKIEGLQEVNQVI